MEDILVTEEVLTTSETIGELSEALAKAQAEVSMSEKDATNPEYRSQYSTLSSSFKAGKGAASKYGLAVVQAAGFVEGLVTITTLMTHKSNEWMKNVLKLPIHKTDIHAIKSAVTYGRRIGYDGLLGIAPGDDDDDGNAGAKAPTAAEVEARKAAKKLRAKMNKVFQSCEKMKDLEKAAREFKGGTYGFWEKATFVREGETFGNLYLAHKDRIGNVEARYTEEGHEKWRKMLLNVDAANFLNYLDNFRKDTRRQTPENETALQLRAQDLGLWDEHNQTFIIEGDENASEN